MPWMTTPAAATSSTAPKMLKTLPPYDREAASSLPLPSSSMNSSSSICRGSWSCGRLGSPLGAHSSIICYGCSCPSVFIPVGFLLLSHLHHRPLALDLADDGPVYPVALLLAVSLLELRLMFAFASLSIEMVAMHAVRAAASVSQYVGWFFVFA